MSSAVERAGLGAHLFLHWLSRDRGCLPAEPASRVTPGQIGDSKMPPNAG
jgi:hypothetical protein